MIRWRKAGKALLDAFFLLFVLGTLLYSLYKIDSITGVFHQLWTLLT